MEDELTNTMLALKPDILPYFHRREERRGGLAERFFYI
jgi:hypothetical protein